jgi:TRAP-type C4-dicarboxylate transport system substrate-binding protein
MKAWMAAAAVLIASVPVHAQTRIKLGTLAPRDSSPHESLKRMAEAWRKAPRGGAQLVVFTDGAQGGEADMVRRMRIGQLQAALLTATGLAEIDDSVTALQTMPLVYRTFDEVDYVREALRGPLERKLADKGFVVLCWVDAGWVRFFSRYPAVRPEDFRKQKIFSWAGDTKAVEIMKAAGYQPIALETADILPGLQTGLIDAVPAPPFFALAGQFYGPAPNMLEMNWAPLAGACVVSRKTWDALPAEDRTAMLEAAVKAGDEIRAQARREMDESVQAMTKRGLVVNRLTPEAEEAWRQVAESAYPKIRGAIVPADLFDEVRKLLAEYRAGK